MSTLKQLAGDTVLYGVSTILGRLLNFLLVPIYTALLPAAEYGIVTEIYAWVAFLNVIYAFGMETTFFRFASAKEHGEKQVFFSLFLFVGGLAIVLSGALAVGADSVASFLDYPGHGKYVLFMAGTMAFDALAVLPYAWLRHRRKALLFTMVRLASIGLNIGLNLALLFGIGPQVEYIFLANLAASGVQLVLFFFLPRGGGYRFVPQVLGKALRYTWPLVFMGLAGVTNEMLSRVLLKYWLPQGYYAGLTNQEALGVFGAAYKLSVFMVLMVQAYRYAAEPFFFRQAQKEAGPPLFARMAEYFFALGLFVVLAVVWNLEWIAPLFLRSQVYLTGLEVVPLLMVGYLFLGLYYNLSVWYKTTDRTRWGMYLSILGAGLTVVGNYWLIPVFGYVGSAMATVITYAGMALVSGLVGRRFLRVPYQVGKMAFLFAAGLGLYFLFADIQLGYVWVKLLQLAGLAFFALVAVALFRPFSRSA